MEFNPRTGESPAIPPREEEPEVSPSEYKKPDSVLFTEELFAHYKSQAGSWMEQVEEDRDFIRMAQWDSEKRLKHIRLLGISTPILEVDVISPAMEQAVGLMTSHTPSYATTGTEDSDVRVAAMVNDVLRWVWNRNMMKAKSKLLLKDYYVSAKGWVHAWWDEDMENGLGSVHYTLVDPLNVFVDSNTQDLFHSDSPHIIIAHIINKEQLLESFPDGETIVQYAEPTQETLRVSSGRGSSVGSGSMNIITDSRTKNYLLLDRYSRVRVDMTHFFDMASGFEKECTPGPETEEYLSSFCFLQRNEDGNQMWYFDTASLRDMERDYAATGGTFHLAKNRQTGQEERRIGVAVDSDTHQAIPGTTVILVKVPVYEAVKAGVLTQRSRKVPRIRRFYSVGGYLLEDRVLPLKDYPIIPLINNFDRTPYTVSDVRRVKGLQEYINDLTSLVVAHAASVTNFKVGYPRGSYEEADLNKRWSKPGTVFIPYEAELGQLTPLQPAPLPNELYRNIDDAKRSVEHILGVYAMGQGDARDAPATYKGTLMLDEFAQRRIGTKREDFEAFLIRLGNVTYDLLRAYMKEFRVIRLTRPNGKMASIAINANQAQGPLSAETMRIDDLSTAVYDITIVSGSTLPTARWAQAEYYMNLYEKGVIDRQEVLLKSDVIDREGVMERMNQIAQLQRAVEGSQEEIKRLKGDLQTAQRESVSDRQKVEVVRFREELTKITANMKAAQEAFQNEMRRELQLSKEQRKQKGRTS